MRCIKRKSDSESEIDRRIRRSTKKQTNHPWDDLATIAMFDHGKTMIFLNKNNENKGETKENYGEIAPAGRSRDSEVTQVLIESLVQQLCVILEEDKVRREKLYYAICNQLHELQLVNDTYTVLDLATLRGKYQRAFCHMLSIARGEADNESVLQIIPKFLVPKLRYLNEFHEISFIARGAFGKVYKARHRLDGIEYAIKKINMPANRIEIIEEQLKEVRALAKLNHHNIVSYNAAWIESYNISSPNRSSYKSHKSKRSQKDSNKSYSSLIEDLFDDKKSLNFHDKKMKTRNKTNGNVGNNIVYQKTINLRLEEFNSSVDVINGISIDKNIKQENAEGSSSDIVSFRSSKSTEKLDKIIISTDTSSNSHESSSREVCTYVPDKNQPYVTLYIQMALCEQTLEQWLCDKINVTEPISRAIFEQILCGVDYIHSENIIHHDIKPSNIFISTSGRLRIQLGDFGLACPLQIGKHHSVIGTRMYAAPEQLEGKCDPKSDIYSIGVVLVELLTLAKTQMELYSIIKNLKCGNTPNTLKQHKWGQIVKQLVQENPAERPSTTQLLQDLNKNKDLIIDGLKDTIVNLKNDNRIKDNAIKKLQEEIASLRGKVKKLST